MSLRIIYFLSLILSSVSAQADDQPALLSFCQQSVKKLPGLDALVNFSDLCKLAQKKHSCTSEKGQPIFYFEKLNQNPSAKKILVISLVHGDEPASGAVAFTWANRLLNLKDSRNSWRIIPILNPDGWDKNTRMNANGVDLNRNFQTSDWDYSAKGYWEKNEKKDPRRFPGTTAASEKETKCATEHLSEFEPDMVIAIHTPYGLLDFDGPQLKFPKFPGLPWKQLGHFPGSIGRFMWYDRKVPVLTIELESADILASTQKVFDLQDLTGLVTIKSLEFLQQSSFEDYKK